jgi:hypothetical protein
MHLNRSPDSSVGQIIEHRTYLSSRVFLVTHFGTTSTFKVLFVSALLLRCFAFPYLLVLLHSRERRLRGGQAGYRHAVGGARDVVEAGHVAELD